MLDIGFLDDTPAAGGVLDGRAGRPGGPAVGPPQERSFDEFYERYRKIREHYLRAMLNKADVEGVGQTASAWYNTSNVLVRIADDLSAGLLALRETWTGDVADAHERRMFALVARVRSLADEAAAMQTGLSMMSASAGIAKNRSTGVPATIPRLLFESGVVDANLGYQTGQPPEMARVVADLALDYAMIEQKVWYGPLPERSPEPPPVEPEPEPEPTILAGALPGSGVITPPPGPVSSPMVGAGPGVITAEPDRIAAPAGAGGGSGPAGMGGGPGMMGMMGGANGAGASSDARGSGRLWREDEMAWSQNEHATWMDPDEKPPPVVDGRRGS